MAKYEITVKVWDYWLNDPIVKPMQIYVIIEIDNKLKLLIRDA